MMFGLHEAADGNVLSHFEACAWRSQVIMMLIARMKRGASQCHVHEARTAAALKETGK